MRCTDAATQMRKLYDAFIATDAVQIEVSALCVCVCVCVCFCGVLTRTDQPVGADGHGQSVRS